MATISDRDLEVLSLILESLRDKAEAKSNGNYYNGN